MHLLGSEGQYIFADKDAHHFALKKVLERLTPVLRFDKIKQTLL